MTCSLMNIGTISVRRREYGNVCQINMQAHKYRTAVRMQEAVSIEIVYQ
jgi:hypothetical protein